MKKVLFVMFFVPGILSASVFCGLFQKNNLGEIEVKQDYLESVVNVCSKDNLNPELALFCDSLTIDDNAIFVTGDYSEKLENDCFNCEAKTQEDEKSGFWSGFVNFLVEMGKYQSESIHWRR
jgi:hypothetical protein